MRNQARSLRPSAATKTRQSSSDPFPLFICIVTIVSTVGADILAAFSRCDAGRSRTLDPTDARRRESPDPGHFESKMGRLKNGLCSCAGAGSRTRTTAVRTRTARSMPAPAQPLPVYHWRSACAWCHGCSVVCYVGALEATDAFKGRARVQGVGPFPLIGAVNTSWKKPR